MNIKEDMKYVDYVVNKYLKSHTYLWEFVDDLRQEGYMALVKGREAYDEGRDYDRTLWLHYKIKQGILDYLRSKELRHFTPPVDIPGHYGPVPTTKLEDIIDPLWKPADSNKLSHYTERIDMTPRQREVLDSYLSTGSYSDTARSLSTSRENVRQVIDRIIEKCKNL